jgi:hypothetical protein
LNQASETGVTRNNNSVRINNFDAGVSVGFFLTDHWIGGVGLDYTMEKEERKNSLFIMNDYVQYEFLDVQSQAILPCLFLEYYVPIVKKLYFNSSLNLSFGQVRSDLSTIIGR